MGLRTEYKFSEIEFKKARASSISSRLTFRFSFYSSSFSHLLLFMNAVSSYSRIFRHMAFRSKQWIIVELNVYRLHVFLFYEEMALVLISRFPNVQNESSVEDMKTEWYPGIIFYFCNLKWAWGNDCLINRPQNKQKFYTINTRLVLSSLFMFKIFPF